MAGSWPERDRRLAAGRCVMCGEQPPKEGLTRCEPCLEANRVTQRQRENMRRRRGLCPRCGRRAFRNRTLCQYHLEYSRRMAPKWARGDTHS